MKDFTFASVYFAYFLFALLAGGAVYFFVRSLKDGYWGPHSEDPKYRMMHDDDQDSIEPTGAHASRRP
jgi:ABC-type nickel/cobalt efflux system permease component RcnA